MPGEELIVQKYIWNVCGKWICTWKFICSIYSQFKNTFFESENFLVSKFSQNLWLHNVTYIDVGAIDVRDVNVLMTV